jgi:alpha-ketoglutarate-dependent taurine dioxygenase
VTPTGPHIGAEIGGVDLHRDVEPVTTETLREALRTHKLLVFRSQRLTPDVAAVSIFGDPFDHPTALRHPDNPLVYPYRVEQSGKASQWHVGGVWRTPSFRYESLVYDEVAALGGDTLWADLRAAYDGLSEPVRALVAALGAVYDAADEAHYAQGSTKGDVRRTVEHPVVRTDPDTARKGLFLSTGALRLTGVTDAESRALLPFLLAHASSTPDCVAVLPSRRPGTGSLP